MNLLDSFLMACNAVLPIVVLVVFGYILKKVGIIKPELQKLANGFCFKILIPVLLFTNIYKIEDLKKISDYALFILYVVVAIFLLFAIGIVVVKMFVKDDKQKGVIHQCLYRSNYAIIGIPLAEFIARSLGYSADSPIVGIASLVSAVSIPLFNCFAVISLSMFDRTEGNKIDVKKMCKKIVTNPLIIGVFSGLIALVIREILVATDVSWRLSQVTIIYTPISQVAAMASPLALIMLGAGFTFGAIAKLKFQIILGTSLRVAAVPAIFLVAFYFLLKVSGSEPAAFFPALIALFSTPVAVSSVPMAVEMNQDGELAGQLVVWTSIMSIFSLFVIIMICASVGIF